MNHSFASGPCSFVHGTRMPRPEPGFVARYVFADRLLHLCQHVIVHRLHGTILCQRVARDGRAAGARRGHHQRHHATRRTRRSACHSRLQARVLPRHPPANCRVLLTAGSLACDSSSGASMVLAMAHRRSTASSLKVFARLRRAIFLAPSARASRIIGSAGHMTTCTQACVFPYRVHVVRGVG